jgi:hypothetical protein
MISLNPASWSEKKWPFLRGLGCNGRYIALFPKPIVVLSIPGTARGRSPMPIVLGHVSVGFPIAKLERVDALALLLQWAEWLLARLNLGRC